MDTSTELSRLMPLAYQRAAVDYLKTEDPAVWKWFAETADTPEQNAELRLKLLKSTYRIERNTQPELYALADEVAGQLGLDLPLTIYHAQHPQGLNASIVLLPQEIHLVLSGPVTTTLSTIEVKAVFGHELAHQILWTEWSGDYRIAAHMLEALANDPAGGAVYAATQRLYWLYGELFCDRGSWLVTEDLAASVSALVKVCTEIKDVSAESYLRQADEIFGQQNARTEGLDHPESYIRARALKLWLELGEDATPAIAAMIESPLSLVDLDLLGQKRIACLTRRLFDELLAPRWFRSERVLAHARSFFDDFGSSPREATNGQVDKSLYVDIETRDASLQDYYCYLLLDFATVDRDLEELPLAAALVLARRLSLADRFKEIALKELKLTKKRLSLLESRADELLTNADQAPPLK